MVETRQQNKRRKKKEEPSPSCGFFESLPDEVALSCLARVSRFDHVSLPLVSKRFRSLFLSPEFYKTRSMMGHPEKSVYVCLKLPPSVTPRWFILRPTLDAATGKTVKRAHPIPMLPSQPREGSAVVALDWNIYVFGGSVARKRTSGALRLDCRYHTWHQVTPMMVDRAYATARVVNGKIYVLGGCKDREFSDWGEVFDPKTQTWAALPVLEPMPGQDNLDTRPAMHVMHGSVVIKDKIYVMDLWNRTFFYSMSECKWGRGSPAKRQSPARTRRDWCVIDNLVYSLGNDGCIHWCEPEELDHRDGGMAMKWTELVSWSMASRMYERSRSTHNFSKSLEDILPGSKMINSGQSIVVFWKEFLDDKRVEIRCAEFRLKMCKSTSKKMIGEVEWSNSILTLSPVLDRAKILYSISVDV